MPGVYVDFKSQYPTSFCLQGLWRYMTARRIDWREEKPAKAQALLDSLSVADVLDPALWTKLNALVQVEPDGDRLPTRARYGRADSKSPRRNFNLALSVRTGGPPVWVTLADAAASKLATGKAPRILCAIRFRPVGRQPGLRPINFGGDERHRVDPRCDDLIRRLVEMRAEVRAEQQAAELAGDHETALRLKAIALAMKETANSIAYGTGIEMNVIEHRKPVKATVHLPDGSTYSAKLGRSEQPGSYFNPLLATLVTGGGRLLLAAGIALVERVDGAYVSGDTDSLFIVATESGGLQACEGGTHRLPDGRRAVKALRWSEASAIAESFAGLNTYDHELIAGSILELESDNYDPKTGQQRELHCFAIAAKRQARFVVRSDGRPEIVGDANKKSRSEHGLGHLLPPEGGKPGGNDRRWMDRWWEHLLCLELGIPDPAPEWFGQPAVGRLTVTSPREEGAFEPYNEGRPYDERVTPWCFMSVAHPIATERARDGGPRCLIAPYEQDPERRLAMEWHDRSDTSEAPLRIRVDDSFEFVEGSVAVQSYRRYFEEYRRHPERKMLGPDGNPCRPWTRGLLQPREVQASELQRIGKESNRLAETPLPLELDEGSVVEYPGRRVCPGCGTEVGGRRKWCSEACRKRTQHLMSAALSEGL